MFQELNVIGRIANEVVLRYTQSGKAVLQLAVIVNNGENNKTTFNFVCFEKQAETHANYLSKEDLVNIRGTMQNKVEERDGHKNYSYNLYANKVLYLSTKKSKQAKTPGEEVLENVVDTMVKQQTVEKEQDPFEEFAGEIQLSDDMLPF